MLFRSLDFMQFSCESGEQEEERWEQEKCGLSSESRQPTGPAKTNSIVSRGKEAGKKKKKSVWHKYAFGSSVTQQKTWKLLRHCCLAHCTPLALQEVWSLITKMKISWSKCYMACETVSFWLRGIIYMYWCQGQRKDACVPCGLKVCSWDTWPAEKSMSEIITVHTPALTQLSYLTKKKKY